MARPVLRGRSKAMSDAVAVLTRARKFGRSGILLVAGEAGIGKTALLQVLAERAEAMTFAVGAGRANADGRNVAAGALLDALGSRTTPLLSGEDVEGLAACYHSPLQLLDEVSGHLGRLASTRPVLIMVDDVQWADRLSRFVLRTLSGRLSGLPLVWAFSSRDPGIDLIADLSNRPPSTVPVTRIDLSSLSTADVAAIATDYLGQIPNVAIRTSLKGLGGNPFLVLQMLDGISRGPVSATTEVAVPVEFASGVGQQVATLDSDVATAVRLAAILSRPFRYDEFLQIMPASSTQSAAVALEGAVESGLLTVVHHSFQFRHDLVREAVYASMSLASRNELHRRCAEYFLTRQNDALGASSHLRITARPGDVEAALVLEKAALEALPALPEVAGELMIAAFRLLTPADQDWTTVGRRTVSLLADVQRGGDAVAVADELLAHPQTSEMLGQIQTAAIRALYLMGRVAEAILRAETLLGQPDISLRVRARLQASHALAATRAETAQTASIFVDSALSLAEAVGDQEALEIALQAAGEVSKNSGNHHRSLANFRRLRRVTGTSYLAQEVIVLQLLDRYDDAQTILDAAQHDAGSQTEGDLPSLAYARMWQDFNLGRFDQAESRARELIDISAELGNHMHLLESTSIHSSVALIRGNLPEAKRRLRPEVDHMGADDAFLRPGLVLMQGWMAAAEGDPKQAIAFLGPLLYTARESRTFWPWWPGWMRVFVSIGQAAGDDRFVEEAASIAEEGAARNPGVATFEGIMYQIQGVIRKDVPLLRRAAEILGRAPRPMLRANSAMDLGQSLLEVAEPLEAISHLRQAQAIYAEMKMPDSVQAVERMLSDSRVDRQHEANVGSGSADGWSTLTEAEKKVAALIAAGLTNRMAARELNVSPNTVGTQLRSVFLKLGIQSRVQLSNQIRGRFQPDPEH